MKYILVSWPESQKYAEYTEVSGIDKCYWGQDSHDIFVPEHLYNPKFCAISDLHGDLPDIEECDCLLIAGDIFPLDCQSKMTECQNWVKHTFIPWLEFTPCNQVIIIAGNHDFYLKKFSQEFVKALPSKAVYLENEAFDYRGIKIYGTPNCKMFGKWAFMEDPETLMKIFNKIPANVDILLTHDAPFECSDVCENYDGHIGNLQLAIAILRKSPKINIHGHLHSSNHDWETLGNTKVINVSIKDESYSVAYKPLYFYGERKGRIEQED